MLFGEDLQAEAMWSRKAAFPKYQISSKQYVGLYVYCVYPYSQ